MSRGPGWLECAILDLLHLNEYLSSPLLAAKAYAAYSADAPDKAINPTPAQRAAVRRSLSRLQKRGLVVKLGSMYPGERCSYADREHALAILRKDVQHFGLQSLRHYPRRVQGLYADAVQPRALNHKRHTQPLDGQGGRVSGMARALASHVLTVTFFRDLEHIQTRRADPFCCRASAFHDPARFLKHPVLGLWP